MTKLDLPYLDCFRDRHGHMRYYVRRFGKRTPLPGKPGSAEFSAAYAAAIAGQTPAQKAATVAPGSIAGAVAGYLASAKFASLAKDTQRARRRILEKLREKHGTKGVATLQRHQVEHMLAAKATTPEAARNLLKALRGLFAWCVLAGLRRDDPTAGLKAPRKKSQGFHTWTEDEVERFRARHPLGTRARLALELAACTGQRRGDLIRMGRQHVRHGVLSIRQSKTGVLVEIPVLPELQAAIDAMPPSGSLTFLHTHTGEAFSPAGFTNWFREVCREAGCAGSVHGLRKYAATRHADNGATAHELMAWFGWETLSEAERYTRAANRKLLAAGMVEKLSGTRTANPRLAGLPTPAETLGFSGRMATPAELKQPSHDSTPTANPKAGARK